MHIVRMEKKHVPDLMEVERLSFAIPWSKNAFLEELENENAYYLCALYERKAIGYIGMWVVLDEGQITNLAVHPSFRRKAVGRKLLSNLQEIAKLNAVKLLTLEVRKSNDAALSLYRHFGFTEVGIRKGYYADNHEDAVLLNLNIYESHQP